MNRYKSRQKWRKVQAGYYKSPDERYWAQLIEGDWWLVQEPRWPRNTVGFRQRFGPFVTLADCQEIAEGREARAKAAWWGYVQGAKADPQFVRSRHGGRGDV